jgi:hemerythrin-like domain-containing protein
MERATEDLINNHTIIQRVMDVMESITTVNDPSVEHLEFIVTIIREYADGFHHAKEEGLLFPKLVEKGIPQEFGPIGMMLSEHEEGRNFVKGMADNLALYKAGNKDALKSIYLNMNGYVDLLRNHISKENNILFRMADQVLTDKEQAKLLELFGDTEASGIGKAKIDAFLTKIKELEAIYI